MNIAPADYLISEIYSEIFFLICGWKMFLCCLLWSTPEWAFIQQAVLWAACGHHNFPHHEVIRRGRAALSQHWLHNERQEPPASHTWAYSISQASTVTSVTKETWRLRVSWQTVAQFAEMKRGMSCDPGELHLQPNPYSSVLSQRRHTAFQFCPHQHSWSVA